MKELLCTNPSSPYMLDKHYCALVNIMSSLYDDHHLLSLHKICSNTLYFIKNKLVLFKCHLYF